MSRATPFHALFLTQRSQKQAEKRRGIEPAGGTIQLIFMGSAAAPAAVRCALAPNTNAPALTKWLNGFTRKSGPRGRAPQRPGRARSPFQRNCSGLAGNLSCLSPRFSLRPSAPSAISALKIIGALLLATASLAGAAEPSIARTNRAERLEWFRDQGFGLFVHWSVDSQLGVVISHSLVGASDDYANRFFTELPKTFNPRQFNPHDLAVFARLAGARYVVFTAKHHSGFCMFNTATTDFSIRHTPYKHDITAELLQAFREQGIAPGLYFSPDDFWWLHQHRIVLQRKVPEVQPINNPGLMAYDRAQVRELFTRYGRIDVAFFDGQAEGLRDLAWQLQPDVVVTRGALQTPEKTIPGQILDGAWEACLTMGDGWQYQSMLENYKSAEQLIEMLIEIRAKGGNLLLNVGPKPNGELPIEQEERLREMALWMFVNGEAIYGVRPCDVPNEKEVWFTKRKDADTVYAFVTHKEPWKIGESREIVLNSVRASTGSQVSVLGQNDQVLEYQAGKPRTWWMQDGKGLHIHFTPAQRLRDNRQWTHPIVLKITKAQPAQNGLRVETGGMQWTNHMAVFSGKLAGLAEPGEVEVGFEFRDITGQDTNERGGAWQRTPAQHRSSLGYFSAETSRILHDRTYEYRAFAHSASQTVYGQELRFGNVP
jgi:alpha-L-fucosidase